MTSDLEARINKAVNALTRKKLLVGIPSDAKQPAGKGEGPPPLWVIGYQNEFGDEQLNIPPRPFLVPGVESVRDDITKQIDKGVFGAFSGDLSAPDKAMHAAVRIPTMSPGISDVKSPIIPR